MESKEITVKIKVLVPFRDKFNESVIFKVGEELDFETERAKDVVARKLVEYVIPVG